MSNWYNVTAKSEEFSYDEACTFNFTNLTPNIFYKAEGTEIV
ncbi:MAG TPA: hypothetical protein VIK77_05375 [Tissierellaceae bacterium]